MLKFQKHHAFELVLAMALAATAPAQMLRGDRAFPVLNQLNWNMSMQEVQDISQKQGAFESAKDSIVILALSFFGNSTRTEIEFDQDLKKIKHVRAKFKEATKTLEDTLVQHLTRICGAAPYKTTKEKNLLIVTLRIQMAIWKSPTEMINLVSGFKGEDMMDLSLVLRPPTNQQPRPEK